ncbi:GHKL domain-containing protein [Anaerocolumna sp. AGMB13025]|uniref:sensor histidine kinase n=1 Tax=Anaerocolumna sp. AGMB13025 TaxID=3039116 RepID=UPI00241EDF97|nr:sensor histidine kinase [Anaerocolumna sp. AGMB13025]WFR59864.1 GHKL domain-containing protein [Anaerocolumna sp. AGMB13025]
MNYMVFIVGLFLSSMVSVSIIMDFLDKLFERNSKKKLLYHMVKVVFIIILAGVNALHNGWINLITVIGLSEYIAFKLYYGRSLKQLFYIICIVVSMGACESIGIVLLNYLFATLPIAMESEKLRPLFNVTISQVFVILISHAVILQIIKKKNINELTHQQYLFAFGYALFSIINIYILSVLLKDSFSDGELVLVLITITGIVIINTHFLKFLEFASDNNRLQYENNLFLQQSKMQYQYYDNIEQQYRESLSILHDVKRHIRAIEELYRHKESETAVEYSKKISHKLDSFRLNDYTDNRMLNIILNDKMRVAEQKKIDFSCRIEEVDLNFIDNIDLTTIFANLLDNAIEACQDLGDVESGKSIVVQVGAFNNLVVITIKNTLKETISGVGNNMKSSKKNHSGIGLPNVINVISKYNGDFNIQKEGNMFVCSIILSKQGRQD